MNLAAVTTKLATVGGPKVQLTLAKVNKYSPQILTGVGIVGGVVGTVLIARATLKLPDLIEEHGMERGIIEENVDLGIYKTEKERSRALAKLYLQTGLALAKIYGPGVGMYAASVAAHLGSAGLSQKRQVALVAALKTAESSFQSYRARVIDAIGAEKEADIRYGISTETIEDENGKKVKVRKFDPDALDEYSYMFSQGDKNWERGPRELNYLFLKGVQNWANDRLNARGFVYLNEVRNWLGIPETPAGQVVGWLNKDLTTGDGYIDFGWEDNPVNFQPNKFGEMSEGILLNFNVDGEINSRL